MTEIYKSNNLVINYNGTRADFSDGGGSPIESIAFHSITDNSSCWDSFVAFILKHFTWTWISVKNPDLIDTDQLININSLTRRVGLTPEEIKMANNEGILYRQIEDFLKEKSKAAFLSKLVTDGSLPDPTALADLAQRAEEIIRFWNLIVDDSSEAAFLASLKDSQLVLRKKVTLIISFAINRFKYLDVAEDWVNTIFEAPDHVSKNGFQPIEYNFERFKTMTWITVNQELKKLKGIVS